MPRVNIPKWRPTLEQTAAYEELRVAANKSKRQQAYAATGSLKDFITGEFDLTAPFDRSAESFKEEKAFKNMMAEFENAAKPGYYKRKMDDYKLTVLDMFSAKKYSNVDPELYNEFAELLIDASWNDFQKFRDVFSFDELKDIYEDAVYGDVQIDDLEENLKEFIAILKK